MTEIPLLQIVGSNNLERFIEVSINGVRYEYHVVGAPDDFLRGLRYQMRFSSGKAIQWLKRNSWKCVRISKS